MKFTCTVRKAFEGRWRAEHAGSALGRVETTGTSREEALDKLRNELQYRLELCPCSGVSGDRAELDVQSEASRGA